MLTRDVWMRGFRVLLAVCLFFSTSLTGWGGQVLAASVDGPGASLTITPIASAVLPNWFAPNGSGGTASVAPPTRDNAAWPLAFDDGPVDEIVVRDRIGDAGTEVVTYTVTADESIVLWAAGYYSGTFVENQTANWSVIGGIGEVSPAVGVSTTFFADTVGTGTVMATHAVTNSLTDATGIITVTPGAVHHFVVDAPPSGTAGVGFNTDITARDANENTVIGFASDVTLSTNGSDIDPTTALGVDFSGGVWSGSVTLNTAGDRTVTATYDTAAGGDSLTIDPNDLDRVAVSPASVTLDPGGTQQFSAQGYDAYDNAVLGLSYFWSVVNDGGTISADGVFTAGNPDGTYADTVQATADDGGGPVNGTASVTVNNLAPTAQIDSGPYGDDEGSAIVFSGTGSDPNDDPLSYEWDFDYDGVTFNVDATGQNPSHAYPDDGDYWAALRTRDDDDALSPVVTTTVSVSNVAPTAGVSNDGPQPEGSAVTVTASQTDPGTADTFTYDFDWDSDGSYEITGQGSASAQHTWTDNGRYTVTVRVHDDDGGTDTAETVVQVTNVAPTAGADNDGPVDEASPATVTASQTDPGTDDTFTYDFDWDSDGVYEIAGQSSPSAQHTWNDDGGYTVTVRVHDDDGGADTAETVVQVDNVAPTVDAGQNWNGQEGTEVFFDGSSTDPGTEDTHAIEWDFGDGGTATGTLSPTHVYTDNGTFLVTLTVTDDDGGVGSDTLTANVSNAAPTVSALANKGTATEAEVVVFNGSFGDAGDGDTHDFEWDFDDGTVIVGAYEGSLEESHAYTAAGTYVATLTVTDDDGGVDNDTVTVEVTNVPPTADISAPPTQTAGLDVTFDAAGSTEPGGNITAYEWDLDDDGQYDDASGATTTVNWTVARDYVVGLRVTDAELTTDVTSVTLTVEPAALNGFVVSVPVSGTAGVAFRTVVTAEDEFGNPITDWDQDVALSTTNGGTPSPTVALGSDFVDGVWDGVVSLTSADDAGTTSDDRDVIASYDGHTGQDTLHIEPAFASTFLFSAIGDQVAGDQSASFHLTAYDAYGNLDVNYDGNKPMAWSGLSASPNGEGPDYPWTTVLFADGESENLRFTAYAAETNVTLDLVADDGPTGASDAFTVSHASASIFDFSTVGDQVAGSSGTIGTLAAEDDYGNPATGYAGDRTLSWSGLGDSLNGDAPDYPANPVSFVDGVASTLVFTPYLAEAGVALTADQGSVSGSSNDFDVTVGTAVGAVVVESAPGGGGAEVTTHDMVVRDSFIVYAAGYDAWGNYIDDQSVTWSGTGPAQDHLSPDAGESTTFTPVVSGTATIEAQFSVAITDATGLITVRAPVLQVSLADAPDPVDAGSTLNYTLFFTNTGNADAQNVVLSLSPDADVDLGSGYGQPESWNLGTLVAGASGQRLVEGTVRSPLDDGSILASIAEIDSDQTDAVSGSTTAVVRSAPELSIEKSAQDDAVPAGDIIIYTLDFNNSGNMNATGVVISDTIPENTVFRSASSDPYPYTVNNGVVIWDVGALTVNAPDSLILAVRVDDPLPAGTVITNANYEIDSNQTVPVSGPAVETAVLSPSLTLRQVGTPDPVPAGGLVDFTLTYTNTGDGAATSVIITDEVPADTIFVSASDGGTYADGLVVWQVGTVEADASGQRQVTLRVTSPLTSGTPIINRATLDSFEGDPTGSTGLIYVTSAPELNLSKSDAPDPVQAGAELVYTLSFTNSGNSDATGLVITDVLPAHTAFVSASDGGIYDVGDGVVTWDLGRLSGRTLTGEDGVGFVTLTLDVATPLTDGTQLDNGAALSCAEVGCAAQASEQTTVSSSPILMLDVTDNPEPLISGDILVYTVSYANTGNADATGVQLMVDYDSRLSFVSADPSPSSGNDTWNLPRLPGEGGMGTVIITLTASALAPDAVLQSDFSLDSAQTGLAEATEKTQAQAVALTLGVDYDSTNPYPGKQITYTLQYANDGDLTATGVELTANLPDGTSYIGGGWTKDGGVYRRTLGSVAANSSGSVGFIVEVDSTGDHRLPQDLPSIEADFSIADDGSSGPELNVSNNQADSFIGIPDLVVDRIDVSPGLPTPDRPVTFTVVVRNQGTGLAGNPNVGGGGIFYVDLFIDPDPDPLSYPYNGDGDLFDATLALAAGETREVVFVIPEGLTEEDHVVWAKVDNFVNESLAPWQRYSLVPESDEENNTHWIPVTMGEPEERKIFLPVVLSSYP